jgi:hypothetical protein
LCNKIYFVVLLLMAGIQQIQAQSDSLYYIESANENYDEVGLINLATIGLGQLSPVAAFKDKLSIKPIAINLSILHQLKKNKPLFIGAEFSYSPLNAYTADVEVDTESGVEFWSSTTSTSLINADINSLYYFPIKRGKLDVFAQFNIGFNWFSTRTTITPPDGEESDGHYDKNDMVGKYGLAIGLHYPLGPRSYIQLRLGYNAGLSAYYYTKKKEFIEPLDQTLDAFKLQKSTTDALKWDLGYTFAF